MKLNKLIRKTLLLILLTVSTNVNCQSIQLMALSKDKKPPETLLNSNTMVILSVFSGFENLGKKEGENGKMGFGSISKEMVKQLQELNINPVMVIDMFAVSNGLTDEMHSYAQENEVKNVVYIGASNFAQEQLSGDLAENQVTLVLYFGKFNGEKNVFDQWQKTYQLTTTIDKSQALLAKKIKKSRLEAKDFQKGVKVKYFNGEQLLGGVEGDLVDVEVAKSTIYVPIYSKDIFDSIKEPSNGVKKDQRLYNQLNSNRIHKRIEKSSDKIIEIFKESGISNYKLIEDPKDWESINDGFVILMTFKASKMFKTDYDMNGNIKTGVEDVLLIRLYLKDISDNKVYKLDYEYYRNYYKSLEAFLERLKLTEY